MAFAAAACIVLAGYNNLAGARPWHRRWYPVVNACAAAAALAAAAASGPTAGDLGLRRDRLWSGLRLGSAAAAPVVAAFGLAALTPATRPLLNDQRIAGLDRRQLACNVLLRIPVGTVGWEEIAFRGVLQAALRRVLAEPAATAVNSAVFGLWHIRPTAEALAVNRLAAGRGARITAVTAVAAGTAGAGALLSLLRERSGSLAAPVLLHLAANCAAPLASALARPTAVAPDERAQDRGRVADLAVTSQRHELVRLAEVEVTGVLVHVDPGAHVGRPAAAPVPSSDRRGSGPGADVQLAPDDLAGGLLGEEPVPPGTQLRHQEQPVPALFLRVGCAIVVETFGCWRLRVGIPDFDEDSRVVAGQLQAEGRLVLSSRRDLHGIGHEL